MRGMLVAWLALAIACGDNTKVVNDDAGVTPDAPTDGPTALAPCLDRPTDLPQPSTQLPCDMLPPGVVLQP
jgi:hypothetical protein